MKTLFILVSLFIAATANAKGGGSSIGPANPAAANCLNLKGTLEAIVLSDGGQDSNCVLDEWTLFQNLQQDSNGEVEVQLANPAAVACVDAGGTLREVDTDAGQEGLCVIAQWTLWQITEGKKI